MIKKASLYILIIAIVLLAGGLYLDWSRSSKKDNNQVSLLEAVTQSKSSGPELGNYGVAPEFTGIVNWLNSAPLTMAELKGKVVLIDFWTYSCINCIRTLPYVTSWYEKYKDDGLVIVGVHTPEFAFEKDTSNVQTAINRHNITYPVAQDNDFATWRAYKNRYWPAHYLIDQSGNVVYYHFGEGKYEEMEQAITNLLQVSVESGVEVAEPDRQVNTPEIYFGLDRIEYLASHQKPTSITQAYTLSNSTSFNEFELAGEWQFTNENARMVSDSGRIRLNYQAKNVFMVADNPSVSKVTVYVDGQKVNEFQITDSKLYELFLGDDSRQRILEIEIIGSGLNAFTFTFG